MRDDDNIFSRLHMSRWSKSDFK